MEWVFVRNCLIITYKVTKNIPFPQLFNTFLTSNSRWNKDLLNDDCDDDSDDIGDTIKTMM